MSNLVPYFHHTSQIFHLKFAFTDSTQNDCIEYFSLLKPF